MTDPVAVIREGPILRVRLQRPEKLNAFSAELVEGLLDAVLQANAEGVRLIVLTGEGKGFSGGFDLSGLDEMSDGDLLRRFVRVEQLLQAVYHTPVATLAFVHGPCYGAAADLVAACQWRVATPDARFRMPGLRFGILLGTQRLAKLVGSDAAQELLLRDRPFDAEVAKSKGFIQEIVEQSDWENWERDTLTSVQTLDAPTFAAKRAAVCTDTRDADMATLVNSVVRGSIKSRIKSYLKELVDAKVAKGET